MIIHQPTIKIDDGEVILSSRIEFANPLPNIPKHLWFSFPESYAPYISDRGEAFFLSMLVPALYFNEDIEVRGKISPVLANKIEDFINVYRHYKRAPYRISIDFKNISEHVFPETPRAVVSPFSGGIDSMYTVWSHLPERDVLENKKLTHGIFIKGFDTFLFQQEHTNWAYQKYNEFFRSLNIELIQAASNQRQFSQYRIDWVAHHHSALKSFPFALGKLVSRFYQPSSEGAAINDKSVMQLLSDPLLSVESLEMIVDGAEITRTEKIEKLSTWENHHNMIRICISDDKVVGQLNCQVCEKCLRTMISIQLAGVEKSFPGFDYKMLYTQILKWWWKSKRTSASIRDFLLFSKKYKRWGLGLLLRILLVLGYIKGFLYSFAVQLIPKRLLYQLKIMIFPGDKIIEK